jgi:O-antigen ligase
MAAIGQAKSFNFAETRVYGAFVAGSIEQGDIMNANSVGLLFAMTAVFTLSVFQHSRKGEKLIAGLVGFACVACTFLTLSRAAMLGLVAGGILLGFYMKERRAGYFGFLLGAVVIIFGVVSSEEFLSERIENTVYRVSGTVDADSVTARFERWSNTLAVAHNYLLVGAGLGNNTLVLGGVVADNQYLEILVCTGLLGFIAFVAFNIIVLQYTQSERVNSDDYSQGVRVGIRGALICFYCANLSGAMLANPRLLGVFWFLAGLACAMRRPLKGSYPRCRASLEIKMKTGVARR